MKFSQTFLAINRLYIGRRINCWINILVFSLAWWLLNWRDREKKTNENKRDLCLWIWFDSMFSHLARIIDWDRWKPYSLLKPAKTIRHDSIVYMCVYQTHTNTQTQCVSMNLGKCARIPTPSNIVNALYIIQPDFNATLVERKKIQMWSMQVKQLMTTDSFFLWMFFHCE